MAINNKRLSQSYSIKGEYNIQCRYIYIAFNRLGRQIWVRYSSYIFAILFTFDNLCEFIYEMIVYKYFKKIDFKYL
jgi:hypothetical protein